MARTRLITRQLSVVVLVISRQSLGKLRDFAALRPVAIGFPTVHKNMVTVDERHGLLLPWQAAHPPEFLAGIEDVRRHLKRAGDDHLRRPAFRAVGRGRGVTARIFRTHGLPEHPAVRGINGNQVRPGVLIADQHQLSIRENGRRAVAVWIVERAQRQTPALVAIRPVGQQPEIAKEHIHIGAVGDRRGGCGPIGRLKAFRAIAWRFPPPQYLAAIAVETVREQTLALEGRGQRCGRYRTPERSVPAATPFSREYFFAGREVLWKRL